MLIFRATNFLARISAASGSATPRSRPLCVSRIQSVGTSTKVAWLTGAVFKDLRKVFDTVNHEVLLNKLRGLGVLDGEH